MAFQIQKVTKHKAKLRMALIGPSGSGKTYSALNITKAMGGRTCVFDTEYGSAAKYASLFDFDGAQIEGEFHPDRFMEAIAEAEAAGYDNIVIDSLTHAWNGPGGILAIVDRETKRNGGNSYTAWKVATPIYQKLVQTILASKCNIIVTLRAKQDYVQEKDNNGRTKITKVGMGPEIREGFNYEMDIEGNLTQDNDLIVGKTRCPELNGKVFNKAGKDVADILLAWLNEGDIAPEPPAPAPEQPAPSVWDKADPWMLQAKRQLGDWDMKFSDIPEIVAVGAPDAPSALFAWAHTLPEGTDPLATFFIIARAAMPKEEAKAS